MHLLLQNGSEVLGSDVSIKRSRECPDIAAQTITDPPPVFHSGLTTLFGHSLPQSGKDVEKTVKVDLSENNVSHCQQHNI